MDGRREIHDFAQVWVNANRSRALTLRRWLSNAIAEPPEQQRKMFPPGTLPLVSWGALFFRRSTRKVVEAGGAADTK
jgi:hypothetical protein